MPAMALRPPGTLPRLPRRARRSPPPITPDQVTILKQQMALQQKQIEQMQKALEEQKKLLEKLTQPAPATEQAAKRSLRHRAGGAHGQNGRVHAASR